MTANEISFVVEPPEYLSPSSISTWQQCPLKFKYGRIDKLVDPPTEATVMGNYVHDVLEQLLLAPPSDRTIALAQSLMRKLWQEGYEEKAADVLYGIPKKMHEFRWRAWWCIENYFDMEDPTKVNFDGLEDYVTGSVGTARIRGYVDRWHVDEENIVIGDYKTGKTPKPQWRGDKFQQLLIYSLLLNAIHGLPVKRLELIYLKDGVLLTHDVTDEDLQKVSDEIGEVHVQLVESCQTGNFEAKKHRLCDWCSYKSFCPAWN
jgi:putative RecB family exonuclease